MDYCDKRIDCLCQTHDCLCQTYRLHVIWSGFYHCFRRAHPTDTGTLQHHCDGPTPPEPRRQQAATKQTQNLTCAVEKLPQFGRCRNTAAAEDVDADHVKTTRERLLHFGSNESRPFFVDPANAPAVCPPLPWYVRAQDRPQKDRTKGWFRSSTQLDHTLLANTWRARVFHERPHTNNDCIQITTRGGCRRNPAAPAAHTRTN
jgi:hypothetical protein